MSDAWCAVCKGRLCPPGRCAEGERRVWRNTRTGQVCVGYNDGPDGLWVSEGDTAGYAWNTREWVPA